MQSYTMPDRLHGYYCSVMQGIQILLEKDSFIDCTLAAEGQFVNAHKLVLSACSPYFQLLFSQQQEKYPIVILKDVKYQNLKAVVDLIYRGRINVPDNERDEFLNTAKSLQINGLTECELCCSYEAKRILSPSEQRNFHDKDRNLLNSSNFQEENCRGEQCSKNSSQKSPDAVFLSSDGQESCESSCQNHATQTSFDQQVEGSFCDTTNICNFSISGKIEEESVIENVDDLSASSSLKEPNINSIAFNKSNEVSAQRNHIIPLIESFQGKNTPENTKKSVNTKLQSSNETFLKSSNAPNGNEDCMEDVSELHHSSAQGAMVDISQMINARENSEDSALFKEFCYQSHQKAFDKFAADVCENILEVMSVKSQIIKKPLCQYIPRSVEAERHRECAAFKSSVSTTDKRITSFSCASAESGRSAEKVSLAPGLSEMIINHEQFKSHSLDDDVERNIAEVPKTQKYMKTGLKSLSSLLHIERHFEYAANESDIDSPKLVLSSHPCFSDLEIQKDSCLPKENDQIFNESSHGAKELAKHDSNVKENKEVTTNKIDQMFHNQEKYGDKGAVQCSVKQVSDNQSIITTSGSIRYCDFSGDGTPPLENFAETFLFSPCDSWQELAERTFLNPSPASQEAENIGLIPCLEGMELKKEIGDADDFVIQSEQPLDQRSESVSDALLIEIESSGIAKHDVQMNNSDKNLSSQPPVSNKKKKRNICSVCLIEFPSACKLKKHSRTHKRDIRFTCNLCCCTFTQETDFSNHLCNVPGQEIFQCNKCPLKFYKKEELVKHSSSHEQFKCEECKDKFESTVKLESHIKIHCKKGPFQCVACKKTFEERNLFLQHLQAYEHIGENECSSNVGGRYCPLTKIEKREKIWGGDGSFKCHSCGEGFLRRILLKEHIDSHMLQTPLQCYKCCSIFHNKDDLYRHILINSSRKPFRCQICFVKFALKNEHAIHYQIHLRNKENQVSSD